MKILKSGKGLKVVLASLPREGNETHENQKMKMLWYKISEGGTVIKCEDDILYAFSSTMKFSEHEATEILKQNTEKILTSNSSELHDALLLSY